MRVLHHDYARIGAKFRVELLRAHIDGVHFGGAALEEAIREASGRGTDVEGDAALRSDRELVQSGRELQAPSRNVGAGVRCNGELRVGSQGESGFGAGLTRHDDLARKNGRLGFCAGSEQPALDEQDVEPELTLQRRRPREGGT